MEKVKKYRIISLIMNLIIFIMEIVALYITLCIMRKNIFLFYTIDSNIFTILTSILMCIYQLKSLLHKGKEIPMVVKVLKYTSTCLLTVTMLTVLFVLIPIGGKESIKPMLLDDAMLYHHLLCPILSFVSFVFFEREIKMNKKASLIAVVPTIIYAGILIILNVLRVVEGPYPFLYVYKQSIIATIIWFSLIIGGSYAFAKIIWLLNKNGEVK